MQEFITKSELKKILKLKKSILQKQTSIGIFPNFLKFINLY